MRHLKLSLVLTSLFLLGACQTYDAVQDDVYDLTTRNYQTATAVGGEAEALLASECPKIEIVDDLSSISDFIDPKSSDPKNLISRVDVQNAQTSCDLSSKTAIVDLKITFNGELGPKGRKQKTDKPFFSFPYFVAVTTPSGKILAKEIFAASMTFNANEDTHTYHENLRQIIPIPNEKQARFFKVLIGFQVTPDQLEYNRQFMVATDSAKAAQKKKPPVN